MSAPEHAGRACTRVLLLGAGGRLGKALAGELSRLPQFLVVAPARDALGLAIGPARSHGSEERRRDRQAGPPLPGLDPVVAHWFERWRPDVVVNCIAMSDVDLCETRRAAAWRLNAALPAALAAAARRTLAPGTPASTPGGTRLVHFSTDFVFDGRAPEGGAPPARRAAAAQATQREASAHDRAAASATAPCAWPRPYRESDAPNPLSLYGESKLAGERAIARSGCRHWTFRVSWLYGAPEGNLAARLLDPSSAGQVIRLAADRIGVPNPVQLLAREVIEALVRDAAGRLDPARAAPPSGLYHLSCRGATSWYEFGLEFLRQALDAGALAASRTPRLEPFEEAAAQRAAARPLWSPLDAEHYESVFGRRMPKWQEAIAEVLRPPPPRP